MVTRYRPLLTWPPNGNVRCSSALVATRSVQRNIGSGRGFGGSGYGNEKHKHRLKQIERTLTQARRMQTGVLAKLLPWSRQTDRHGQTVPDRHEQDGDVYSLKLRVN